MKKILSIIFLILFILIMTFFTIHQFWIGNVFYEIIHPAIIYLIFSLIGIILLIEILIKAK